MSVTHGQAARVAKQLALIGTAGELATAAGITGWPAGSAADAVLDAYQLWQSEQGSGQTEDRQILESVRSFIERHGESRFAPRHATSAHPIRERAGYTEEDPATGQVTYLFLASGLREALSGQDLKRGLIALAGPAGWSRAAATSIGCSARSRVRIPMSMRCRCRMTCSMMQKRAKHDSAGDNGGGLSGGWQEGSGALRRAMSTWAAIPLTCSPRMGRQKRICWTGCFWTAGRLQR
ncbi:hypothetical protein CKO42_26355 [Lamprobacter modestohalophilus]|uniref:Uncharacterized protein n=1 Tax=Lamprobacter modestohalophilus TaxID=1064514 RepID=A0A9X0WE91_9GAMM|nr:hypothetical protein [Lamprobacter modestohalophilus]MBK1621834.1 hypothetical protein [Lamprobacter modestohalophilus]MCF7994789.1 hypothetical protein [Chromatiaceae bacterium]MCF8016723.1 hypothetical protein [Chromatiaceae bacterium]